MHELGVLSQAVKSVDRVARENGIENVKHITLAVGKESGFLPVFFHKLFPVAVEHYPAVKNAELRIEETDDAQLTIKEIGY